MKKICRKTISLLLLLTLSLLPAFSANALSQKISPLLKEIYPADVQTVIGGSKINLSAVAYHAAAVTATFNGITVNLAPKDGTTADDYTLFTGSITAPPAAAQNQSYGSIVFTAAFDGYSAYSSSDLITVMAAQGTDVDQPDTGDDDVVTRPTYPTSGSVYNGLEIDAVPSIPYDAVPAQPTGPVKKQVRVTGSYADVYRYKSTDDYAEGILYQLANGMTDVVSKTRGGYYDLASGKTVYKSEVTAFTDKSYTENTVRSLYAYSIVDGTFLSLRTDWRSPVSVDLNPYAKNAGVVNSFPANEVVVTFDYLKELPDFNGNLNNSPLFSGSYWEHSYNTALKIDQVKLHLTLRQTGRYYGCHTYYDETGRLILRFNHPPYDLYSATPLAGINVIVDPGHGKGDPGAIVNGIYERTLNLPQATLVTAELRRMGANVIQLPTDTQEMSLQSRLNQAFWNKGSLLLCCHHNTAGNTSANGTEVYYAVPFSQPLTSAISNSTAKVMTTRGSRYKNFYMARSKQMPSTLIEFSFMTNKKDLSLAQSAAHQTKMAKAVVQGVIDYYRATNG